MHVPIPYFDADQVQGFIGIVNSVLDVQGVLKSCLRSQLNQLYSERIFFSISFC